MAQTEKAGEGTTTARLSAVCGWHVRPRILLNDGPISDQRKG